MTRRNNTINKNNPQKKMFNFLPVTSLFIICCWFLSRSMVRGFAILPPTRQGQTTTFSSQLSSRIRKNSIPNATKHTKSTALNVWWFGGSDTEQDDDSCELVAVRIERTSPNSRRIAGSIVVPKPLDDVWAILTDYDNLAIHVPNLVESRRVNGNVNSNRGGGGYPGDGSYQCRLFQKGAQKIVGFEFGASVTMDMTEQVLRTSNNLPVTMIQSLPDGFNPNLQKKIIFKCVESQFFSEFDGEWKVSWTADPDDPTKLASMVEYVVDVRPRGPVPVQALEWRIREDVPTNLRAVKAASIELGKEGVEALRNSQRKGRNGSIVAYKPISVPPPRPPKAFTSAGRLSSVRGGNVVAGGGGGGGATTTTVTMTRQKTKLAPVRVEWYEDETMAAYLTNKSRNSKR